MSTNPLKVIDPQKRFGNATVEDLQKLAADLNSEWWVKRMGRDYFVSQERNPKFKFGSIEHKEREFIHALSWRNV